MSKHHVIPSTRGGVRTVELPDKFHESWHGIFANLTPRECILFIIEMNKLMEELDWITTEDIQKLRERLKKGAI